MSEDTCHVLAAAIFAAGTVISIYFRSRANRNSPGERLPLKAEETASMLLLRLVGLSLWLGIFAYLMNPAWMAWAQTPLPAWLRLGGAALGILSVAMLYRVFSSPGNNVTPTVLARARHKLVTSGPYHWVRHPLYTVGFLSYLSFAILAANCYVAVMAVATLVLLALRVPRDEAELIARNGEAYRAYAERAGRFVPKLD